jgi:hypothetical protein
VCCAFNASQPANGLVVPDSIYLHQSRERIGHLANDFPLLLQPAATTEKEQAYCDLSAPLLRVASSSSQPPCLVRLFGQLIIDYPSLGFVSQTAHRQPRPTGPHPAPHARRSNPIKIWLGSAGGWTASGLPPITRGRQCRSRPDVAEPIRPPSSLAQRNLRSGQDAHARNRQGGHNGRGRYSAGPYVAGRVAIVL